MDDLKIEFLHERPEQLADGSLAATEPLVPEREMGDGLPAGNDPSQAGVTHGHKAPCWQGFKV